MVGGEGVDGAGTGREVVAVGWELAPPRQRSGRAGVLGAVAVHPQPPEAGGTSGGDWFNREQLKKQAARPAAGGQKARGNPRQRRLQ